MQDATGDTKFVSLRPDKSRSVDVVTVRESQIEPLTAGELLTVRLYLEHHLAPSGLKKYHYPKP